ncbi:nucleotide-binding protein [Listeria booriae]|uniref:nucleotide-binding protein n=1 Tax=Listeria booriae TaxID=1552123 RepID=UPI00162A8C02|nr:hypothetical protein [Listeria booriae]MBC2069322.1 hypothetical protein [Listeria booriae]MBC6301520.1 hypothetical protein [Listeria booriae]MCD2208550.1 hypothetical protein [Listeria booriae]
MSKKYILVVNRKGGTGKTVVSKALVNKLKNDKQKVVLLESEEEMGRVLHTQPDYAVYDVPTENDYTLLISEPMFQTIVVPVTFNKFSLAIMTKFITEVKAVKETNTEWNKEIIIALTQTNDTSYTSDMLEKITEMTDSLNAHVIDLSIKIDEDENKKIQPAEIEQFILSRISQEKSQELAKVLELVN